MCGTDFKCSMNLKRKKTVTQSGSARPQELEGKRRECMACNSTFNCIQTEFPVLCSKAAELTKKEIKPISFLSLKTLDFVKLIFTP